jgi:phosphoglycolate phosphatase-like HAD superfamily hydrolase
VTFKFAIEIDEETQGASLWRLFSCNFTNSTPVAYCKRFMYLIFDFDGVIGDTWETAILAHIRYGSQPNREAAIAEMQRYFNQKPHHTRNHNLSPEQLQKEYAWTTEYGKIMHDIGFGLFTSFVSEIEKLQTAYKAIVSSGSQSYVLPALKQTNINPTHILAFEDHHSKEEKIEAICRDWKVSLNEVYYFTDSLADVYELENCLKKEKLIGVNWGFSGRDNLLKKLDPEQILDTPGDIQRLFI